tara:strand:+ start:220 stop:1197 length:978 start_codon:yes stop_codon:yes gene_type:complete
MNSYTTEQLLMCEKGDLVKYIEELKARQSIMNAMSESHIQDMNEIHDEYKIIIVKLKAEKEMLQDMCRSYKKEMDLEHIRYMEEQGKRGDLQVKIDELKEENEKLKKQNEVLKKVVQGAKTSQEQEFQKILERTKNHIENLKEENEKLKIDHSMNTQYWRCYGSYVDPNCDCMPDKEHIDNWCKNGDVVDEKLKEYLYDSFSRYFEEEESEDEDLYADDDDWVWGYGNIKKDDEYVIHISGGGDPNTPNGFEDWVIKKNIHNKLEYFIRHGGSIPDKKQVGKKLVSCPDGNYVSFQDDNYKLRGNESDFEFLLWEDDEFKSYQEE